MTSAGKDCKGRGYNIRGQASRSEEGMTASSSESEGTSPRPPSVPMAASDGPSRNMTRPLHEAAYLRTASRRLTTPRPPQAAMQAYAAPPPSDTTYAAHDETHLQTTPFYQIAAQLLSTALQLHTTQPLHNATTSAMTPDHIARSLNDVARSHAESLRRNGALPPYIATPSPYVMANRPDALTRVRATPSPRNMARSQAEPSCRAGPIPPHPAARPQVSPLSPYDIAPTLPRDYLPLGERGRRAANDMPIVSKDKMVVTKQPLDGSSQRGIYGSTLRNAWHRKNQHQLPTSEYEDGEASAPRSRSRSPFGSRTSPEPERPMYLGAILSQSPLSQAVRSEPLPPGFHMPDLPIYNGGSDPMEHVHGFRAIMLAYNYGDVVQCRVFPTTLRGVASRWFYHLPPNSIENFADIATPFTLQFSREDQQSRRKRRRGNRAPLPARQGRYQRRDIPLTAPLELVLKTARNQGLLPMAPSGRRTRPNEGPRREGYSYSSEEDDIASIAPLVRRGYLLEYVHIGKLMDWADIYEPPNEEFPYASSDEKEVW